MSTDKTKKGSKIKGKRAGRLKDLPASAKAAAGVKGSRDPASGLPTGK
jgi:hypothetical protein